MIWARQLLVLGTLNRGEVALISHEGKAARLARRERPGQPLHAG